MSKTIVPRTELARRHLVPQRLVPEVEPGGEVGAVLLAGRVVQLLERLVRASAASVLTLVTSTRARQNWPPGARASGPLPSLRTPQRTSRTTNSSSPSRTGRPSCEPGSAPAGVGWSPRSSGRSASSTSRPSGISSRLRRYQRRRRGLGPGAWSGASGSAGGPAGGVRAAGGSTRVGSGRDPFRGATTRVGGRRRAGATGTGPPSVPGPRDRVRPTRAGRPGRARRSVGGPVQVRSTSRDAATAASAAPAGPPPSSSSTSSRAVGRRPGSFASAADTSRRSGPASPARSGWPCRIRCASSAGVAPMPARPAIGTVPSVPHGLRPVAAYATRLPQLNTSDGRPDRTRRPAGPELLRRHPARRPDQHPDLGVLPRRVQRPGDAEVDHPRPGQREQHVGRLQVPVHDTGGVHGGQRGGHPERDAVQGRGVQRAALGDRGAERHPVDELGDQVRRPGGRVGVQHPGRAEGRDPARGRHLVGEPGPEVRLAGQLGVHHLDRDRRAAALGRPR